MSAHLKVLRYEDTEPKHNPTGESLLSRSEKPFKVWIPDSKWVVLGNSQEPEKELNIATVLRDGIPIYKRRSGGGAVLLSPGSLCLGLRFAKRKDFSLHDYFNLGSNHIRDVVRKSLGVELESKGISDLVHGDRKVVGCALYMPREYVLYLASLLIDSNFSDIENYLAHPSKEPEYRSRRRHGDFLAGLSSLSNMPMSSKILATELEIQTLAGLKNQLDW